MKQQRETLVEQMEAILYKIAEQDSRSEQDLECIIAISNWLIPQRVVLHTEMETLVIDIAHRYTVGKQLPFDLPSLEDVKDMLTAEKPTQWWGNAQDVYEWALRARDEILEGKNYMASKGLV